MQLRTFFRRFAYYPIHPFLLVIFFLSHGYSENIGLVPVRDLFTYLFKAALFLLLLTWVGKIFFKSWIRAGLIVSLLAVFYLFYGALQDGLKTIHFSILAKYSLLVPAMLAVVIGCVIFFKRKDGDFRRATLYLNSLLILLIAVDAFHIVRQSPDSRRPQMTAATFCDTCFHPDIYLIVMDEYWGSDMLYKYYGYDNHEFTDWLSQKGFYVVKHPSSNYSVTPISMAATFDMNYVQWLHGRTTAVAEDYALAASKAMTTSAVVQQLKSMGYHFNNCSIFDILDQPAAYNFQIIPAKMRLITSKTFLSRAEKDLLWNVKMKWASHSDWLAKKFQSQAREGNNIIEEKLLGVLNKKSGDPAFTYAHLMMPHQPSLYDSLGHDVFLNYYGKGLSGERNDSLYLGYLVYTNKQVENILSKLMKKTEGKAVVIVMSDHGYRYSSRQGSGISKYNNFNAVYLPSRNYGLFYDTMSNVNQFRVIFNSIFDRQLPLLRDSTVF